MGDALKTGQKQEAVPLGDDWREALGGNAKVVSVGDVEKATIK